MSQSGEILRLTEAALKPLVEAQSGSLDVAVDLDHAMKILATSPKTFRVIMTWEGYSDHPTSRNGMANSNFLVILHHNPGLAKDPATSLHTQAHEVGELSFLARLEQVSAWFRALRFPGRGMDCDGFVLTDSQWAAETPGNTRAHAMTFTIQTALPSFSETIIIPAPE
jgi:hypothetical protein